MEADADRKPPPEALRNLLLYGYLIYTFVGTKPFAATSAAERVEGNPLDRFVVLGLFAASIYALWRERVVAWRLCRDNALLFAIIGFCQLSVLWSAYPGLSLRRATLFTMLTVIAAAVAVSETSLKRFHTALFATLCGVIVVNLAGVALVPSLAVSDIGAKGLYTQKNMAGMVAMIAVIVGVIWTVGQSRGKDILLGLGGVALAGVFLVLTRSKTSIGLAATTLGVGVLFVAVQHLGQKAALVVLIALALALCVLFGLYVASDFDAEAVLALFVKDTTFTGRSELWAFAYKSIMSHPWLGHGYGAFWDVGDDNDPLARLEPGTWLGDVDKGVINQAHNGFLELGLHIGAPMVVVAVICVLRAMGAAATKAIEPSPRGGERQAYAMIALILFVHVLHNFTEATLFMRGNPFCNLVVLLIMLARSDAAPARSSSKIPGCA